MEDMSLLPIGRVENEFREPSLMLRDGELNREGQVDHSYRDGTVIDNGSIRLWMEHFSQLENSTIQLNSFRDAYLLKILAPSSVIPLGSRS
ncbi:MAG: hypothetical protein ACLFPN_00555 [Methanomassiliicoccales archaeon]